MYDSISNFINNTSPDKILAIYEHHLDVKDGENKNQKIKLKYKLIIAIIALILIAAVLVIAVCFKSSDQLDDMYFTAIMVAGITGVAIDLRFILKSFEPNSLN